MVSSPEPQAMSDREDSIIPLEKPVQSQFYFSQKDTSNSLPHIPKLPQETEPVIQQIDTPPAESLKVSCTGINWPKFRFAIFLKHINILPGKKYSHNHNFEPLVPKVAHDTRTQCCSIAII